MYIIYRGRIDILRRRDLDQEFSRREYLFQVKLPVDACDSESDTQADLDLETRGFFSANLKEYVV